MANKKDFIASGPTKPDVLKSHFDESFTNNFTANFGKIYPLGTWLCPAGSHFRCDCDYGFDLQPLVFPVQTNMRFHVKFYKAPLRILWKNWRNFVSRGGKGYEMPYISRDSNFYQTGSLSDYMGVPSFQTTEHIQTVNGSLGSANYFCGSSAQLLSVGDYFYYNPNKHSSPHSALTNPYFCVGSKINPRTLSAINGTLILRTSVTNSSTISASGVYLYFAVKTLDSSSERYNAFTIVKVIDISSADVRQYSTISYLEVSADTLGDLTDIKLLDNLYMFLVYPKTSRLGYENNSITSELDKRDIVSENGVVKELSVGTSSSIGVAPSRPFVFNYSFSNYTAESRATHFMSVEGNKPKLPLLAFRWRMYEFIYNYFIRNERVTPFMLPDSNDVMQQVFNQYLTNDGDGADSTTPVDFNFAPYEYDLFTTCVKKPTFGDAPLVGVSFNYDSAGDTPTGEFMFLRDGQVEPETIGVSLDSEGRLTGITNYSNSASEPNLHNLNELINFGISINDLRNVSAYQRFLERMTKAGTKYENIMYEFFGTNPPTGEEFPSYLGGYTDLIRTDKVMNQSASNPDVKLGEYGGNAYLRSKPGRRQIRAFCQEDCYIMAVGWFSVTPTYSQKLDKDFVFSSLLDFVNPQFASISPQPVYDYQIAPLEIDPNDDEALHHVFGYNRPFAEAVSRQDECHGLFRSNMHNFIMQRIFSGVPQLNEQFLYMRPEDMSQIFAVTETTDKIFGQIHFDANCTLPLPHVAVPKII